MADLSNTCLVGANLSGAVLTGANLVGADLRGAILRDASLLVADLHNTLLHGADLRGARSLTIQQLHEAHYDHTTQFDTEIDSTMPRLAALRSPTSEPDIMPGLIHQVLEAPLLLPQAPGDSRYDAWPGVFPVDIPENNGTLSAANPISRQNGAHHARAT
jgi:uncharacterized protein YjbI with pentapeptide repeats